jgi:hypothetical protein
MFLIMLRFVVIVNAPQCLQMILRTFQDEVTQLPVIYGKIPKSGCCIASAGRVILIGKYGVCINADFALSPQLCTL